MSENKKYPIADWQADVAAQKTLFSYDDWVSSCIAREVVETIKVEICDVTVTRRIANIPVRCPNPKCLHDLTQPSALKVWEFADHTRHATIEEGGDLDWPDVPEAGESHMQMSFSCARCDWTLGAGKETERPALACYDCGRPATFFIPDLYKERTAVSETAAEYLFCGLCAVEKAADGATLQRTAAHEKALGYEKPD